MMKPACCEGCYRRSDSMHAPRLFGTYIIVSMPHSGSRARPQRRRKFAESACPACLRSLQHVVRIPFIGRP